MTIVPTLNSVDQLRMDVGGESEPLSVPSQQPRLPAATRPRVHDQAILFYLGREQMATSDQVVYRFWVFRGKGARHGYTVIRQLKERGLITATRMTEALGRTSPYVLQLTTKGWSEAGFKRPRPLPNWTNKRAQLDFMLQQTEERLVLEAAGFRHVPRDKAYAELRRWALDSYRRRTLTDTERTERGILERAAPFEIEHRVVVNDATGQLRIVLPIREGLSFKRTISQLPHFRHFPPLVLHLVAADKELAHQAKDYIRRWSRKHHVPVKAITESKHHLLREPAFRKSREKRVDIYEKFGVSSPHTLIRPGAYEP